VSEGGWDSSSATADAGDGATVIEISWAGRR
jgi:hypothetical protein